MKTIIEKMKMKMVKKYENENESDLSIFRSFSKNMYFCGILPCLTDMTVTDSESLRG